MRDQIFYGVIKENSILCTAIVQSSDMHLSCECKLQKCDVCMLVREQLLISNYLPYFLRFFNIAGEIAVLSFQIILLVLFPSL